MISSLFLPRLQVMNKVDVGLASDPVDERLSDAVLTALDRCSPLMRAQFLSGETVLGVDQADEAWFIVAADVFSECDGPRLSVPELGAYQRRVLQLGFAPLGLAFSDALLAVAERDGWPSMVAQASGVPLPTVQHLLQDWPAAEAESSAVGLQKIALASELEFHANDEWQVSH